VQGQLEARHGLIAVPCRDAVDLWGQIYAYEPDDWQRDILLADHPRVLMNTARQSGKSTVAAILGLFEALYRPPALVLLVSASLRQATELGLVLFRAYRRLGKPVSPEAENRLSLELLNGSRILCLPAREGTIRGLSGARLIICDEAARVPDELYHALRPMLAVSQGRFMALSTPWGQRGWWHRAYTEEDGWLKVQVVAQECPRISAAFLAEERRSLPPAIFQQEYECVFGDLLGAVFRFEDITAALSPTVTPLFEGTDGRAFTASTF
jgi:hypothetical protein